MPDGLPSAVENHVFFFQQYIRISPKGKSNTSSDSVTTLTGEIPRKAVIIFPADQVQ